jgi:hypothetical protein
MKWLLELALRIKNLVILQTLSKKKCFQKKLQIYDAQTNRFSQKVQILTRFILPGLSSTN